VEGHTVNNFDHNEADEADLAYSISDEELEASVGPKCTCTYLPSRLSTSVTWLVSNFVRKRLSNRGENRLLARE